MEKKMQNWIKRIPEEKRAEVLAKLQKCGDAESVLAVGAEYALPMTEQIAGEVAEALNAPGILSDDDLALIAGGTISMPSDLCHPEKTVDIFGCD